MAGFATPFDEAVEMLPVIPGTAHLEGERYQVSVASSDRRDRRLHAKAVGTLVYPFHNCGDDEGGRNGQARVRVSQDDRLSVLGRAVEESDRRGSGERFLFRKIDDCSCGSPSDNRISAYAACRFHVGPLQLVQRADGEPGNVDFAVAIEQV